MMVPTTVLTPTNEHFRALFDGVVRASMDACAECAAKGGEPQPIATIVEADDKTTVAMLAGLPGDNPQRCAVMRMLGAMHREQADSPPVVVFLAMLAWVRHGPPGMSPEEIYRTQPRAEKLVVSGMTHDGRDLLVAVDTGRSGDEVEPIVFGPVGEPACDGESVNSLLESFWEGTKEHEDEQRRS